MGGPFEALSNFECSLFEDIFPKPQEKRERGMPHSSFRYVLNTLLYILITGCRWCDVQKEKYGHQRALHIDGSKVGSWTGP